MGWEGGECDISSLRTECDQSEIRSEGRWSEGETLRRSWTVEGVSGELRVAESGDRVRRRDEQVSQLAEKRERSISGPAAQSDSTDGCTALVRREKAVALSSCTNRILVPNLGGEQQNCILFRRYTTRREFSRTRSRISSFATYSELMKFERKLRKVASRFFVSYHTPFEFRHRTDHAFDWRVRTAEKEYRSLVVTLLNSSHYRAQRA